MKLSVLIPIYNEMPFLPQAIESIQQQTLSPDEIVIIDDGSTDGSWEYLYGVWHQSLTTGGPTIRLFKHTMNEGLIATLNEGLQYCQGEFIARMDGDDISLLHRFETQYRFLEENPDIDGCGSQVIFFGTINEPAPVFPLYPDEVRSKLWHHTTVPHSTYFFRRRIYEEFQYDPQYPHAEDVDFLFRVTEQYKIANVLEYLLLYRTHPGQVSVLHREAQQRGWDAARIAARKRLGGE